MNRNIYEKYFNADSRKSNADTRRYFICGHLRAICENLRSRKIFESAQKGISLLELLIAISLLLLVLAAAISIDMAGQRFFKTISEQANIQDELQPAMEHMVKNIQLANARLIMGTTRVVVRIDDNNTPSNFTDDTLVTYRKSGANILYSDTDAGITDEVIAKWITNTDIFSLTGIFLTIKLQGQRTISGVTESATLISGVTLRCCGAG